MRAVARRGWRHIRFHRTSRESASTPFAHAVVFGSLAGRRIDYQMAFGQFGLTATTHRDRLEYRIMKGNPVTVLACLLHPNARGSVSLRSNDPHDLPAIRYEYASDP